VNRYTRAEASFDATHLDPAEGAHLHGHRFTVSVVEQSEVQTGILEDLHALVAEVHLRPLGDMLVGGAQTGPGLASWFMERLLTTHPRITSLEVWWNRDVVYGVKRDVR
jgi:hypothetical protein